jgi:hypothetical protein
MPHEHLDGIKEYSGEEYARNQGYVSSKPPLAAMRLI